jgi:hypothetical protein
MFIARMYQTITMKINLTLFVVAAFIMVCSINAANGQTPSSYYVFSYFIGNGEDGLLLAISNDGYKWNALKNGKSFLTPTAGKDKLMRDPSIVQSPDGTFHMVWTVSWGEKGIGYAYSKDLINWSEQKFLPVMEHEPLTRNSWAPELFYDQSTQDYLIVWASTIPGKFSVGEEQKYNHRLYYVTTKDFNTFSETKLFYDYDFSVIDGAIAKSESKYLLFLKDETDKPNVPEKNIRVATADSSTGPYTKPSSPITGDYWAEGPTPIKINNTWFVYFDKYTKHQYGVVTSKDLINWNDESEKLSMPEGIRHGTAFKVSGEIGKMLLKNH